MSAPSRASSLFAYPTEDQPTDAASPDALPTASRPFLDACTDEDWDRIVSFTDTVRYAVGDIAIGVGSMDRALVMVVRGEFEVLRPQSARGPVRVAAVLGPGSVAGEQGFCDGCPADATVRARTEAQAIRLPLSRFESMAAQDPNLAMYVLFDLARAMSERLRSARADVR